jgi:general nucleoside transport system permease protein
MKYLAAVGVAAVAGLLVVLVIGGDPGSALGTFLWSSLGSLGGLSQTLNKACPLLLGGLAVALALRAGYFNIGVDGQIYAGAIAATGLALGAVWLPAVLLLPAVLVLGALGGAALAVVPGVLRARWSVNEIFVTVMLNFVAALLTEYLTTGPWNDPMAGEAISRLVPEAARLPMISVRNGAHGGIVLALGLVLVVWLLLERTTWGFEVRALGSNPRASRVAGVRSARLTVTVFAMSGALAGLAGAVEVSALHQRLILGLTPGFGIMALLVAVLGKSRPAGVLVTALGMATLLVGSDSLQRSVNLPASAALVFQALIVLSVLFADSRRPAAQGAA